MADLVKREQAVIARYAAGKSMREAGAPCGWNAVRVYNLLVREGVARRPFTRSPRFLAAHKARRTVSRAAVIADHKRHGNKSETARRLGISREYVRQIVDGVKRPLVVARKKAGVA